MYMKAVSVREARGCTGGRHSACGWQQQLGGRGVVEKQRTSHTYAGHIDRSEIVGTRCVSTVRATEIPEAGGRYCSNAGMFPTQRYLVYLSISLRYG